VDNASPLFNIARFQLGQWVIVRPKDQSVEFSHYGVGGWKRIGASALPEPSRFSSYVMLLPDQDCSFRMRSFPAELLVSADLDEAVALDIELWSPFQEPVDSLSFATRRETCWDVSVWVWPKRLTERVMAGLPEGFVCTHVMPQMAWSSACLRATSPALLIHTSGEQQLYAHISIGGLPTSMAAVSSEAEAKRYCSAFCHDVADDAIYVFGEQAPIYCADKAQSLSDALPRPELLARARLPDVMDWRDPLAWKRPILMLAAMVMLWLMADAVVLNLRGEAIDTELVAARGAASQVLTDRNQVTSMQERLSHIYTLQRLQARPEQLISRLGDAIPKDIWLNMIQLKGQWLDISGKGKDVARLTVLLESVEGIKKVFLVGDIRPDAHTGLEIFQVRLQLANEEGA